MTSCVRQPAPTVRFGDAPVRGVRTSRVAVVPHGKMDLIIRDVDAWGSEAMARRVRWMHPTWGPIWVSTLEDLILAKLEWSEGISELQQRDCASLLRMNRDHLDHAYLECWGRSLGVDGLLEAARRAV